MGNGNSESVTNRMAITGIDTNNNTGVSEINDNFGKVEGGFQDEKSEDTKMNIIDGKEEGPKIVVEVYEFDNQSKSEL